MQGVRPFFVICALASLAGCNGGGAAPPPFDTGTAAPTLSGKITEFTGAPNMGPVYLTAGPDGNVWFTDSFNDRVGRITPAGAITEFSAGITALSQPLDIAQGPDANWFFRATGPRATLEAQRAAFDGLVHSIRRSP